MGLELQPISYREACAFIDEHHSHHLPPQGYKFGIAVNREGEVCGVVTVGRPVSRVLDDGYTAEVTRCCTDRTPNAASKLYAAAWRASRAMGYRRIVTYTLASERGTSLTAAGYTCLYKTTGGSWDTPARPRVDTAPRGQKRLWEMAAQH